VWAVAIAAHLPDFEKNLVASASDLGRAAAIDKISRRV